MAKGRRLLVFLALSALACAREDVPPDLIGRWASDDPRYADRLLEINPEKIAFGLGAGGRMTYAVQGVERESDSDNGTVYRVYYDLPGEPERALELRLAEPDQLTIGSRNELWTRQGAPTTGG